ncbi:uncharacterized protein LOC107782834 isoform X2 [Nicotiana tabacum]|uniref:Uncharacterized protein LOC107782834 isoform X2 n=1 Tax=Nicotiana tabacum TaxID=4097 RepID=A0AC58RSM0_TOBAC
MSTSSPLAASAYRRIPLFWCTEEQTEKHGIHLLALSHLYLVPQLKQRCTKGMAERLTIENAVDVLQLARQLCDAPDLYLKCMKFLSSNFKKVEETEGWKFLQDHDPCLELEILQFMDEADSRKKRRRRHRREQSLYLQLSEAMVCLEHICTEGCTSVGPYDMESSHKRVPCSNFDTCQGLQLLIRHFASCKTRANGGCLRCKRRWQLLRLHASVCDQPQDCRVPLCRGYRPDINFTSGPSGSHHLIKNVHHGISSHYDFENEQVEPPVLTQWTENDILHQDLADAQSEEQNSDYDNNADESVDETPFFREDGDEQDEKEGPDLKRDPPRRRVYKSKVLFHSREIPYIDNLPTMSDVEALTRDFDKIRTAMWDESRPTVLAKGMLFLDKVRLSKAYKMHNVKECREMQVWESSPMVYKVVCRRWFWPCNWMLRATKKKTGIWKMGKYIPTHTCEMYTFNGNHFNLDIDLISLILIPHLEASIRYTIKECITSVHQEYGHTITKRKAFLRRKRAFEIVYGNWDKSFASLPKYMAAMQHFNPGTVVEWKLEQSPGTLGYIFNYVFWAFKPAIYDFSHCRPVISIDGTHIYGKYDIKLLIAVAVDANGQIFPLAFAVCANESTKTWTLFLNHLKEHVVKQRLGICLIFDRHGGILSSVENLPAWQEPYAYHCYCVRHFKANFQKAHPNKDLHDLMWMAATDHQQHKFRRHMDSIRQEDQVAYRWLMRHDPEKWTLHADGGRRWGILTTNMSESFNGLLK